MPDPKLPTVDPFKKDDEDKRKDRETAPAVPKGLENEPDRIKSRAVGQGKNPLELPSDAEKGKDHRFGPMRTFKKQGNIPSIVGDGPVSVRGPDERQLSAGTEYVIAKFDFRSKEKADMVKQAFLSGERDQIVTILQKKGPGRPSKEPQGPHTPVKQTVKRDFLKAEKVTGPSVVKFKDPETNQTIEYYTMVVRIPVGEDKTGKELVQYLRSLKASEVEGPRKEGAASRFELTVQKRSGATETLLFKTREEAEQAKKDIEQGIKDNPVQGIAARRVGKGVSTLRQRGTNQRSYFSERGTQLRKHAAMWNGKDPEYATKDAALRKIADDLGLEIAIPPGPKDHALRMELDMLQKQHGPEKAKEMVRKAKKALDDYIADFKLLQPRTVAGGEDLDALKPKFNGSFRGQVHTVKGPTRNWQHRYIDKKSGEEKKIRGQSMANRELSFTWDGEKWVLPHEFSAAVRGDKVPTKQLEPQDNGPGWKHGEEGEKYPVFKPGENLPDDLPHRVAAKGKKFSVGKRGAEGGERDKPVKIGGRTISPSDPDYAQEYIKILSAVGQHYMQSPITKPMGDAMMDVVRITRKLGSPTEASLTKLADALLDLTEKFETGAEKLTPRGRENLAAAIHAGNLVVSQPPPVHDEYEDPDDYEDDERAQGRFANRMQNKLGIARPPSEPKSRGAGFREPREPGRKHVAVAPGLPPKLADKIPSEYQRGVASGWEELDYMLRGGDDSEFEKPLDSSSWQALKQKLGHRFTPHAVTPIGPRPTPTKAPKATKAEPEASADTPWRALAKLRGRDEDEKEPEDA